ncbi:SRPBCC domain-containing protein, partial [Streptomyces sp. MBT57]|nr:SRPBCC domain-containing protein [Streptomyces sp. MBT57]
MNGGTRQGIDLTRVLHAPQRRVFAAWTSPEDFAAWYGGEADVPL